MDRDWIVCHLKEPHFNDKLSVWYGKLTVKKTARNI